MGVHPKSENAPPWETCVNAHSGITRNSQTMNTTPVKHGVSIQHNVTQHSAVKRNVTVIRATAWMNLANVLNERSQIQKKKPPMMWFNLHERPTMGKTIKTERLAIAEGQGALGGNTWRAWAFFWRWWKCSKTGYGDGCTTPWMYRKPWIVPFFFWIFFELYLLNE